MRNKSLNLPIKLVSIYLFVTYVLYFFGPWKYENSNTNLLVIFLISCLVLLYLGYKLGILLTFNYDKKKEHNVDNTDNILRFLKKSTFIALIMAFPDFIYNTQISNMSFLDIVIIITRAFTDPYQNYSRSLNYVASGSIGERLFVIINVLLYFFRFLVLPISIRYWEKISRFQKNSAIILTLIELLKWLIKGMNKGIFDTVIIVFISLLVRVFSNQDYTKKKVIKKNLRNAFTIAIILIIGAITIFGINAASRSQTSTISYYNAFTKISADPNNVILNMFPKFMQRTVLSLFSYLTQGYNAVSLGMKLPFESCYGFGHNMFFITNIREYLGLDFWDKTYMVRISERYEWDSLTHWHSLYSWIANDVSYLGVPIVMFFLGVFLSYVWKDTLINQNPFAGIIFTMLFIECIYIPANNQIGAYPYMTVSFYITIIAWIFSRKTFSQRVK